MFGRPQPKRSIGRASIAPNCVPDGKNIRRKSRSHERTKAIRIAGVKYLSDHTLRLRWVNGSVTPVDLREPVYRLKGLQPLRNKANFAQARKGEGGHSVVWPGDLDMGADQSVFLRVPDNFDVKKWAAGN